MHWVKHPTTKPQWGASINTLFSLTPLQGFVVPYRFVVIGRRYALPYAIAPRPFGAFFGELFIYRYFYTY
jgi:hypothetical protein